MYLFSLFEDELPLLYFTTPPQNTTDDFIMAGPLLAQELLNSIFEYVLVAGDTAAPTPTSLNVHCDALGQRPVLQNKQQQICELPTKRLRSASEQQTASHSKQASNPKKTTSAHGTLCSASRVCKSWNTAATKLLYRDPGHAISRYEGLYLPHLLVSLRKDAFLRDCVRGFTVTASLEAGLWVSDYAGEGDLFCELIELCPRIEGELLLSNSWLLFADNLSSFDCTFF